MRDRLLGVLIVPGGPLVGILLALKVGSRSTASSCVGVGSASSHCVVSHAGLPLIPGILLSGFFLIPPLVVVMRLYWVIGVRASRAIQA
jgi:hypothetical protein